jgi:L-alanine-DL-glutamate epimerase-like enolase superfamily enzyme
LTPGDASFIATALDRNHLLWLDEPTEIVTSDALAKITDETVMPVGLGRKIHDVTSFQNLLRWGSVDILRPNAGLNSIPKIRRMASVAETHYVAVGPYHDGVQSRPLRPSTWPRACRISLSSRYRSRPPRRIAPCVRN